MIYADETIKYVDVLLHVPVPNALETALFVI